jgi:rhamnosyltransferase
MISQLRHAFRKLQIIVVDSSSEPGMIRSHKDLANEFLTVAREEFDHGATRNLAASRASGDVLVFLTQDAIIQSPESLVAILAPLRRDPLVGIVYGRQLPRSGATPIERLSRTLNYPEQPQVKSWTGQVPTVKDFFNSNAFAAYRREIFFSVGGFPENIILNEDMLINIKVQHAGYRCCYAPDATVVHSHHYTPAQQLRRYFDIGASLTQAQSLTHGIRSSGDGLTFVREVTASLVRERRWGALCYAFADLGARWLGFRLGRRHAHLPLWMKRRLSYFPLFWRRNRGEFRHSSTKILRA